MVFYKLLNHLRSHCIHFRAINAFISCSNNSAMYQRYLYIHVYIIYIGIYRPAITAETDGKMCFVGKW